MKKQSLSWLALLLAVVLSVGFASCKDDDDDGGNTSIIGTWRGDYSSGYYLITFREDGTGVEQEYDREDGGALAYGECPLSFPHALDRKACRDRLKAG